MAPLERVSRTRPVGVLDVDAHKQGDEPDHDAHDDDADDRGTGAAVAVASRELPEEEASPTGAAKQSQLILDFRRRQDACEGSCRHLDGNCIVCTQFERKTLFILSQANLVRTTNLFVFMFVAAAPFPSDERGAAAVALGQSCRPSRMSNMDITHRRPRAQSLLRLATNLGLTVDDDNDNGHANCTQQTGS
ncbi:hypothetical protein Purlil1_4834 [Purpureocillium lilacinum]|uniref:Uncharacterized protein n=1 Tax=Purpureocillium lilacinum TaxID=33203 RepID=A0ABR0C419_PURLI|nr:hypothetical protein Purlil1_4834 [Purpureocillium lilacinum]